MILEYSIKNVFSFKELTTFSFEASNSDKKLTDNYSMLNNKYKILNTQAIYGSNACGKSNLFKALGLLLNSIKSSNFNAPNSKLMYMPFMFDKESQNNPSEYEIKCIIKKKKYTYKVSFDANRIYEEKLSYVENGTQKAIFTRTNTDNYYFPEEDREELNKIKKFNTQNKFFISTATSWNCKKTKPMYDFLTENIIVLDDFDILRNYSFDEYSKSDSELIEFMNKFLYRADFSISNFKVRKTSDNTLMRDLPMEVQLLMNKNPEGTKNVFKYEMLPFHKVNGIEYPLPYELESLGTQTILQIIPVLKDILDKGKILFIDELDRSLHTMLSKYIVNLFQDKESNKNNAQLIFNTHDTNLLNLELLRRDQIWFIDKNREDNSSILYPLTDFEQRNNAKIEDLYLLGKFGAIPHII